MAVMNVVAEYVLEKATGVVRSVVGYTATARWVDG